MANWDMVKVHRITDSRVLEKVKQAFSDITTLANGSLIIRAKDWEVPVVFTQITKEYCGARIVTECCPISEQYLFVYTKEYFCGVCITIGVKINYIINEFEVPEDMLEYDVEQEAIEKLSIYDSVINTGLGFIVNVNEGREFHVEFMHRGYLVKATKKGHFINIEVLEGQTSWVNYETLF